ncbi:hypothetical protein HDU97_006979 [Phlyctochytrium planicorne]|nr:hypothetical protein HDU97_006979 [Phlyctochytrium planicorne]
MSSKIDVEVEISPCSPFTHFTARLPVVTDDVPSVDWKCAKDVSNLHAPIKSVVRQLGTLGIEEAITAAAESSLSAYNALVNSSANSVFDTLLQLEKSYAEAVDEAHNQREQSLANLESQHADSLDHAVQGGGESNVSYIVTRHVEDVEMLQATTESQLQELYSTQRSEYRDFVIKVYDEMIARDTSSGPHIGPSSTTPKPVKEERVESVSGGVEGQKVLSAAIKKLERMPSNEMLVSSGLRQRKEDAKRVQPEDLVDEDLARKIKDITEMGFTAAQAKAALTLTSKNSQQAKLSAQGSAPLKKMSSMLGKAIGALVPDENVMKTEHSDLSETFTIYFGTQVKTMYNLRLSVLDFSETFFKIRPDPSQELAYRAQTASSLYSNNLSALIVLLSPHDFKRYKYGKTANPETQLNSIEDQFEKNESGDPNVLEV